MLEKVPEYLLFCMTSMLYVHIVHLSHDIHCFVGPDVVFALFLSVGLGFHLCEITSHYFILMAVVVYDPKCFRDISSLLTLVPAERLASNMSERP